MSRLDLSIILITLNEAHNLRTLLPRLHFASEIIVLDAESQDETVSVAKQYTDQVFVEPFEGFGKQKQRALEKAKHTWVLSIDADEIPSDALIESLYELFEHGIPESVSGFLIPFDNRFCGQVIRFGDFRHKPKLRLFRRQVAHFSPDLIHETCLLSAGEIRRLKAPLHHHSYPNLETVLRKMQLYAKTGAEKRLLQGKSSHFWQALLHGMFTFIRGYCLKLGFLDGKWGFILAWSRANECFYRHLLCWQGSEKNKSMVT